MAIIKCAQLTVETTRGVNNRRHEGNSVHRHEGNSVFINSGHEGNSVIIISTVVTYLVTGRLIQWSVSRRRVMKLPIPPTDDRRLRDFYHNWTNSILQQQTRKFCKIAGALFRISSLTDSFK
jgi:hypothetical protein